MSVNTFDHHGWTYNQYETPVDSISAHIQECCDKIQEFSEKFVPSNVKLVLDIDALYEVFLHVDKRVLHYKMYHGININQIKEMATICHWFIHYKPLVATVKILEGHDAGVISSTYSEMFCLWLLEAVVNQCRHNNEKSPVDFHYKNPSKRETTLHEELLYYFRHRITSPDSILAIAEALVKS